MGTSLLENWPTTYAAAVALQEQLRHRVELAPLLRPPRLVAGVDAICDRTDTHIFGAVAVYRYQKMESCRVGTAHLVKFFRLP
jgi:deoxyribonuclease V